MATDLSIQQAFLDGIEEVFSIMFTQYVVFTELDTEHTVPNIYGETTNKVYGAEYTLVAKVQTTFEQGELPVEGVVVDAVFTIPTKQLITNNIDRSTSDSLELLAKGKMTYKGIDYQIHRVVPKTLVADEWQFYDFICYIDKKDV